LSALDPSRAAQAVASLTQAAGETGATLVTTMHDVPVALRSFPRIVGLRDGALVFDLPAAEVTAERLHALYEQRLEELQGIGGRDEPPAPAPLPVQMHCR
jgi:phosphonate transport system ATP-binding protein